MIRHLLNPPNWFTAASVFCSTWAVMLLLHDGVDSGPRTLALASVLVVFGGVFDMLDGKVARLLRRFSDFGVQLDSIADMLGFGLAPALIIWTWKLHELGTVGAVVAFAFVIGAAFRLARFNVQTYEGSHHVGFTQGLSTTMAGGSLVTLSWVANGWLEGRFSPAPGAVAALTLLLGGLMISSVPFRDFKDARSSRRARNLLAASLTACITAAITMDMSMFFGVGGVLYICIGLVEAPVVVWKARRQRAWGAEAEEELESRHA